MLSLESLKSDEAALRRELESGGAIFRGKTCKCIFHEDRSASAGIFYHDGIWLFKCHGCNFGGDIIDVRARLNKRTPAEELRAMNDAHNPPRKVEPPAKIFPNAAAIAATLPNVEDVYTDLYTNPETNRPLFSVIRWRNAEGKKAFTQCSVTAGGWWMKAPPPPLPIANRKGILSADLVVVVEGEKCIRALSKIGIVGTTSPGGALKGGHADWSPLAGKNVVLWPDFDAPDDTYPQGKGVEHMRQVKQILQTLTPPPRLFWVDPTILELPAKGDAADYVEHQLKHTSSDGCRAMVDNVLADAEQVGIAGDYLREIQSTIKGERRVIPFPWQRLTLNSRALMRGKVTCICGDGGARKSLFISECVVAWHIWGETKIAIYHLEDDRNYHLSRVHAQLEREANLTDPQWVEGNGEWVTESFHRHQEDIEGIGRCIWESPDEEISLEMLVVWIEERAKAGAEIIIIDPITAAASGPKSWIADLKFITRAKVIGRRYGCRIIFITHPRTGTKAGKATHNDMAGGSAYPRFSHTVLWLERNDAEVQYVVRAEYGQAAEYLRPNHIVGIAKARNGPGAGRKIAFNFDSRSLTFSELGEIVTQAESA